ncbi:hypothetical protein GCM10010106_01400 [Thermopolyspora flexuosa]|jgi:hypothetical protein|uniref:Uncharacterized protein DUF397 n=1 Tax=Thermopolyspora flexuosa TaxID=103836 RepID=A0A543IXZ2_9ACTN|nr:DUF397 domain-containing protein [Thermopolyspora flexuosa]TQM75441.1 uncharacterized protein DUF397 [Thermopolyspora flexuosa]GGM59395.1 hypothetical protein GCM10010106_01400 [Thermopolyspora flexuosa]
MQAITRPSDGWRKSSYSGVNDNCVEAKALQDGSVAVRDSKNPGGRVLRFSRKEWGAFLTEIKAGRL